VSGRFEFIIIKSETQARGKCRTIEKSALVFDPLLLLPPLPQLIISSIDISKKQRADRLESFSLMFA